MKVKEKKKAKQESSRVESPAPAQKMLYDNRIKHKNVLALNEKVAAIREYQKIPVYKRVGRMFQCSPDQIKRIVQQKDTILKAWEQRTRRCQDAKTLQMKVVRVSMLGKAVYEWIRRMMYYKDIMITDGLIQKMALQFKSAMGLQNFFPHQEWCDKFRQTYKIYDNDSKMLNVAYTQGFSVQIKDVMKDVLSECTPEVVDNKQHEEHENEEEEAETNDVDFNDADSSVSEENDNLSQRIASGLDASPTSKKPTKAAAKPLPRLVALPFPPTQGGMGMSQKVLVATPIPAAGQAPGSTPMTMTIIPLTTLGQHAPAAQNKQALSALAVSKPTTVKSVAANNSKKAETAAANKQLMPTPLLDIKQEIKEEYPEIVDIKQECITDDEEEQQQQPVQQLDVEQELDNARATAVQSSGGTLPSVAENSVQNSNNDSDAMNLANLRRFIKSNSAQFSTISNDNVTTTTTAAATVSNPIVASIPPMPPLKKAPNFVATEVNRQAAKRRHNPNPQPKLPAIQSCSEARKYLKLLEDFALYKENFRLIGLITRADEVLRDLDGSDDFDME